MENISGGAVGGAPGGDEFRKRVDFRDEFALDKPVNAPGDAREKPLESGVYVVGTPIGNLEDLTFRALRVLRCADIIAAEDTRNTRKLLSGYGIRKRRLVSLHAHNEKRVAGKLIEELSKGASLAVVSDGGTPCISDPGLELIARAHEHHIPVFAVPGASAVVSALSIAGLPAGRFVFEGFLPVKDGARRKAWERLEKEPRAIVLYEAPHRIMRLLDEMREFIPNRRVAVCRELTKVHESVLRGFPGEVSSAFDAESARGELTVVVSEMESAPAEAVAWQVVDDEIARLSRMENLSARDMAERLSREFNISFRKIYKRVIEINRRKQLP